MSVKIGLDHDVSKSCTKSSPTCRDYKRSVPITFYNASSIKNATYYNP